MESGAVGQDYGDVGRFEGALVAIMFVAQLF